jgi:acyl-coenzyme A synthetase/AMP-(fatty) acid ligase
MLKNVSSHTMLVARLATNPLVAAVRALLAEEQYEVNFIEFPILEDIYPELGEDPDQAKFEKLPLPDPTLYAGGVAAYLHTSGSAGFPKSVGWTHKLIHGWSYGCRSSPVHTRRAY